jgi:hypothetical protein
VINAADRIVRRSAASAVADVLEDGARERKLCFRLVTISDGLIIVSGERDKGHPH